MLSGKNKEENKEAMDGLFLKSYYACSFIFEKFYESVVQNFRRLRDRSLLKTEHSGGESDKVLM